MKIQLAALFITVFLPTTTFAAGEALEAVKKGPEVICKDHPQRNDCQHAVNNLIIAVKNISQLNETCISNPELKEKMDEATRKQCESAKQITDYISGMSLKR